MSTAETTRRKSVEALERLGVPRSYNRDHLGTEAGKYFLEVTISDESFRLPVANVGTSDSPLGIAFLDTNPEKNPRLFRAASRHLALLIAAQIPTAVIMPGSKKSEPAIQLAARLASAFLELDSQIPVIRLATGKDEALVRAEIGLDGTMTDYRPVTLLPHEQKFIGITAADREMLQSLCPGGLDMLIVDDVGTTMATILGAEKVLGLDGNSTHHISFLAREAPLGIYYPPLLSPRVHAGLFLPEIEFPAHEASYLHSPADIPAVV